VSAKHTPGPWTYDAGFIVGADDETIVADLEFVEGANEANAKLIIAAPEMFSALRWVKSVVRHKSSCPKAEQRGDCACGLRQVEDALAKAGEL
jgi:hypothetical protein